MVVLLQVFGPITWWIHSDPFLWPTATYHGRISLSHTTVVLKALTPAGLPDCSFFQPPGYRLVLLYSGLFHTAMISSASPRQSLTRHPLSDSRHPPAATAGPVAVCAQSLKRPWVPFRGTSCRDIVLCPGITTVRHTSCFCANKIVPVTQRAEPGPVLRADLSWGGNASFLWFCCSTGLFCCGEQEGFGSDLSPAGMLACLDFTQISTKCSVTPAAVYLISKFLLAWKISHLNIRMFWKLCGDGGVSPSRGLVVGLFCFVLSFSVCVHMH